MRETFHTQLDQLLEALLATGEVTIEMLSAAMRSLANDDAELAESVIARDDEVDRRYGDNQNRIVRLLALQAPVASDLRLLTAMLHVNIHLERMGDYAAGIAKMGQLVRGARHDQELMRQLEEMSELDIEVARTAMRSFAQRDLELARSVPALDDAVDRLNIGVFQRLLRLAAGDDERMEWATHMILVARHLERFGDHAVDIADQTIYVLTGATDDRAVRSAH